MSSTRNMRKSVLSIAMGLCLASLASAPAFAQSVTGAVAGRAEPGSQVTVTNPATGLTRTVTVAADGSYRIGQLPPGDYSLTAGAGAPVEVNVSLGGTTQVNLSSGGAVNLDTIQVIGSRVVNRVDVRSTESSTNLTREEYTRLPVDQSLGSVALLAPGVVPSASLGGLSFGGSSVAENATYINGLNVTDPYLRQGYSSVPFAFYQEVQVKTGGYSAEFGRTTGGVINAVTRSGGNEFHGGLEVTLEPAAWEARHKDRYYRNGDTASLASRDRSSFFKTNLWASGPIVKDRLFFFAMYERRDSEPKGYNDTEAYKTTSDNDFWGAKLDWNITDDHKLELLAFSDKADSVTDTYNYDWDSARIGDNTGQSTAGSGGDSWSATYTGHFGSNFTAKALYGINKSRQLNGSPWDAHCSIVSRDSSYTGVFGPATEREGCHPTNGRIFSFVHEREAMRLDFEWSLGNHLLRFGADQETMDSTSSDVYPGDGVSYRLLALGSAGSVNGVSLPAGTGYVDARLRATGAPVSVEAQAIYLEDNWSITPNLLLNLGLRADKFENSLASGATFAKADFSDMISPRVGFSWDIKGDGTTKLFGNAGRYYIPLTNKITDYFGGGTIDEHTYYQLAGWSEQTDPINGSKYLMPVLGAQIGPVDTKGNAPAPTDVRTAVAGDLKQVFQDEYILGFQQALNQTWSYGVNLTYRKVTRAVEDVFVTHVEGCDWYSYDWPILNPGEKNELWCPDTESWVEFDSSKGGYLPYWEDDATESGYKKPRRTYKAVELQLDRAWDGKWAFNASYIWSKSDGNVEGPVNSDTGLNWSNLVQYYDHPAVNERYGPLYNDHRHQIKLRGNYTLNDMWSFGATLSAVSGGPITAYGASWPGEEDENGAAGPGEFSGGGSGWLCVEKCFDPEDGTPWSYTDRVYKYSPRGAFGRMPWVTSLGASVTWTLPVEGIDLKARLSVYNVFNSQSVVEVHSRYESSAGVQMPYFGQGWGWQSPRYMNLVVTWNF